MYGHSGAEAPEPIRRQLVAEKRCYVVANGIVAVGDDAIALSLPSARCAATGQPCAATAGIHGGPTILDRASTTEQVVRGSA
jgi:hypothetical protein